MEVAEKRQTKEGDGGYNHGITRPSNSIKRIIDKQNVSAKCKMCGEGDETVGHIE